MRIAVVTLALFLSFTSLFAQADMKSRTLMKRTVWYVTATKTILSADYWSLNLGRFDVKVDREFPGEGVIGVECSANLNFLSSGYVEGTGYGERGKMNIDAKLAVQDGDTLKSVDLKDVDYLFMGGTEIKLISGAATTPLFLSVEGSTSRLQSRKFVLNTFTVSQDVGELKAAATIDPVLAISFTKEGAQRALKAALAAAAQ